MKWRSLHNCFELSWYEATTMYLMQLIFKYYHGLAIVYVFITCFDMAIFLDTGRSDQAFSPAHSGRIDMILRDSPLRLFVYLNAFFHAIARHYPYDCLHLLRSRVVIAWVSVFS